MVVQIPWSLLVSADICPQVRQKEGITAAVTAPVIRRSWLFSCRVTWCKTVRRGKTPHQDILERFFGQHFLLYPASTYHWVVLWQKKTMFPLWLIGKIRAKIYYSSSFCHSGFHFQVTAILPTTLDFSIVHTREIFFWSYNRRKWVHGARHHVRWTFFIVLRRH